MICSQCQWTHDHVHADAPATKPAHYYRTTRARETGLLVTVCHGDDEGLDTSDANGGAWYNICNEHGFLCAHRSLSLAKSFASCPSEWCEECAALVRTLNPEPQGDAPEWTI